MLAEVLRRSAWLAVGSALGRVLPLVVLLSASRHYDAIGFATASAGFAWAGVAMSLSSAGLTTVLTQQLGPLNDAGQRRALLGQYLRRSLLASSALALVVMAFGAHGVGALFGPAIDGDVAWPAALSGGLWSQVSMTAAALNGIHRARAAALTLTLSGLLQGLPMLLALTLGATPVTVVWALALGSAAAMAMAAWQVRTAFGPGVLAAPAQSGAAQVVMVRPVLWHTLATAAVSPAGFFASSLIAHGPDGPRQLALYFLLQQIYLVVTYGPAMLGQALMPMMSRSMRAGDISATALGALTRQLVRTSLVMVLPGLLLAAALTADIGWLLQLLPGTVLQAQDVWAVRWLLASAALVPSLSLLGGTIQGRGEIVRASQLNLAFCALFIGGTLAWSSHGTAGLELARLAAGGLLLLVTAGLLWQGAAQPQPLHPSP